MRADWASVEWYAPGSCCGGVHQADAGHDGFRPGLASALYGPALGERGARTGAHRQFAQNGHGRFARRRVREFRGDRPYGYHCRGSRGVQSG